MKQVARHIKLIFALVLLVATSGWLAVPRNICITKVLVEEGCTCAAAADSSNACPCCSAMLTSGLGHCGDHSSDNEEPAETTHSPNCLLVSADVLNSNGAERVQPVLPTFGVVAVLPMELVLLKLPAIHGFTPTEDNQALNHSSSYRDNCVLLI